MFDDFFVGDAKEVIERGVDPLVLTLTYAKHEIALGQNTMDALIFDLSVAFVLGFQCGPESGNTVRKSRIVLGVGFIVDIVRQPVELSIDEYGFNESSNERAVAFGEFMINGLSWTVNHATPGLVWPLSLLDVVPVFHRTTVFKPEHFKTDFTSREIILSKCKDEIAILRPQ